MARPWYRAGDLVRVLPGQPGEGQVLEVAYVRTLAADGGYVLRTKDIRLQGGIFFPQWVELARPRTGGNPCGSACDAPSAYDGMCLHCRGACDCRPQRRAPGR